MSTPIVVLLSADEDATSKIASLFDPSWNVQIQQLDATIFRPVGGDRTHYESWSRTKPDILKTLMRSSLPSDADSPAYQTYLNSTFPVFHFQGSGPPTSPYTPTPQPRETGVSEQSLKSDFFDFVDQASETLHFSDGYDMISSTAMNPKPSGLYDDWVSFLSTPFSHAGNFPLGTRDGLYEYPPSIPSVLPAPTRIAFFGVDHTKTSTNAAYHQVGLNVYGSGINTGGEGMDYTLWLNDVDLAGSAASLLPGSGIDNLDKFYYAEFMGSCAGRSEWCFEVDLDEFTGDVVFGGARTYLNEGMGVGPSADEVLTTRVVVYQQGW